MRAGTSKGIPSSRTWMLVVCLLVGTIAIASVAAVLLVPIRTLELTKFNCTLRLHYPSSVNNVVVRSQDQLASLCRDAQVIDFSQNTIVAVFSRVDSNIGSSVKILEVRQFLDGRAEIRVQFVSYCLHLDAFTYPYDIVLVSLKLGPTQFTGRNSISNC